MIATKRVPAGCLLGGVIVRGMVAEALEAGRHPDPCKSCWFPRERCNGRPQTEESSIPFGGDGPDARKIERGYIARRILRIADEGSS